jgi:hypothetical protein
VVGDAVEPLLASASFGLGLHDTTFYLQEELERVIDSDFQ